LHLRLSRRVEQTGQNKMASSLPGFSDFGGVSPVCGSGTD